MNITLNEMNTTGLCSRGRVEMYNEIFVKKIYEAYHQVESGDIVMDIGANIGMFPYSLKYRNPKMVYCIEPSNLLYETLLNNLSNVPYNHVAKKCGVTAKTESKSITVNEDHIYGDAQEQFVGVSFKDLISELNVDHIDFMKIDCEGGEYQTFTEENYEFLTQNVDYITGEWHLSGLTDGVKKFIEFKNLYLKGKNNFRVFEPYIWKEVTKDIVNDDYIYGFYNWWDRNKEAQLMVYIDNHDRS